MSISIKTEIPPRNGEIWVKDRMCKKNLDKRNNRKEREKPHSFAAKLSTNYYHNDNTILNLMQIYANVLYNWHRMNKLHFKTMTADLRPADLPDSLAYPYTQLEISIPCHVAASLLWIRIHHFLLPQLSLSQRLFQGLE